MNWAFVGAGCIALLGGGIHGVVGDRLVRRLEPEWLGRGGAFLIRVTWHFTTIAFIVLGAAVVWAGLEPESSAAPGLAYGAGALFAAWALFALISSFVRGRLRGVVSHPAPFMLSLSAALIWCGSRWL